MRLVLIYDGNMPHTHTHAHTMATGDTHSWFREKRREPRERRGSLSFCSQGMLLWRPASSPFADCLAVCADTLTHLLPLRQAGHCSNAAGASECWPISSRDVWQSRELKLRVWGRFPCSPVRCSCWGVIDSQFPFQAAKRWEWKENIRTREKEGMLWVWAGKRDREREKDGWCQGGFCSSSDLYSVCLLWPLPAERWWVCTLKKKATIQSTQFFKLQALPVIKGAVLCIF